MGCKMIWHWMCHVCADTRGAPVNLTCYWGSRHVPCVHIQKCPCSHGQLHVTFIKAAWAEQRCCLVSYLSKQMNLDYKTFHTCLIIDITVHGLITKVEFWCSWICASYCNSYRNGQQDATVYKNLLFHVYMKLNMFRVTHRPSSGTQNH
jgi:hypothetical protein